jgi:hypothetical protein
MRRRKLGLWLTQQGQYRGDSTRIAGYVGQHNEAKDPELLPAVREMLSQACNSKGNCSKRRGRTDL